MTEGTEGRDTDGAGSRGMVEEQSRLGPPGESDGRRQASSKGADTDGLGSPGMVEEQADAGDRPALPFEHGAGHDTDGAGSGGILDEEPVDLREGVVDEQPSSSLDDAREREGNRDD